MRCAHGDFLCLPQEFGRPQAAKKIVICFWGGSADPKNTSRKNSPDNFYEIEGEFLCSSPQTSS